MKFEGVLFFPVTAFDRAGRVDPTAIKDHIQSRLDYSPGGLFPACGTGEFHSLSVAEVGTVVETAVRATSGAAPVLSGAGGPLGHAIECAKAAESAGADGLLLLPPYLVNAPVDGLVAYVEAVAAATELPLVVYHRANARFTPEAMARLAKDPQVIGFKDGDGDVGETQRMVLAVQNTGRTDFQFFNGLLTAELTQAAFRGLGVPLYSSAAFAMAPEIATAFYRAYIAGDEPRRTQLLTEFYEPLVALRDKVPGYAVSLIKAGVAASGLPVGGVRPPLLDPTPEHLTRLQEILAHGHDLVTA